VREEVEDVQLARDTTSPAPLVGWGVERRNVDEVLTRFKPVAGALEILRRFVVYNRLSRALHHSAPTARFCSETTSDYLLLKPCSCSSKL
jgi:hypothetical protein